MSNDYYKAYEDGKEWLIACGTCIHTKNANNDCAGGGTCLIRGIPSQKLIDEGYDYAMNFKYLLWETIFPKTEIYEMDPELFEI